jgi:class 3 adenylate cyclase
MMEAAAALRGYVARSTGDGIFALFGSSVAREDHPLSARRKRRRECTLIIPVGEYSYDDEWRNYATIQLRHEAVGSSD